MYNLLVEPVIEKTAYEPSDLIARKFPVACAVFTSKTGLLGSPGRNHFQYLENNSKKIEQVFEQAKMKPFRCDHSWTKDFFAPRAHNQAMRLTN
jgi:hypothetical protein